jgi:hypothetical protein
MSNFLRGFVLITAMIFNCEIALAEVDRSSANYLMPGCRAFLQPSSPSPVFTVMLLTAECSGLIEGLIYARTTVCLPAGVTSAQAIRIVVKYIDDEPARLHENFKALALEALRAAWPCRN